MTGEQAPDMEAIQAVVDRVSSYHDGAPDGTVEDELRKAFAGTDVDVSPEQLKTLAGAIETQDGDVLAAEVLS